MFADFMDKLRAGEMKPTRIAAQTLFTQLKKAAWEHHEAIAAKELDEPYTGGWAAHDWFKDSGIWTPEQANFLIGLAPKAFNEEGRMRSFRQGEDVVPFAETNTFRKFYSHLANHISGLVAQAEKETVLGATGFAAGTENAAESSGGVFDERDASGESEGERGAKDGGGYNVGRFILGRDYGLPLMNEKEGWNEQAMTEAGEWRGLDRDIYRAHIDRYGHWEETPEGRKRGVLDKNAPPEVQMWVADYRSRMAQRAAEIGKGIQGIYPDYATQFPMAMSDFLKISPQNLVRVIASDHSAVWNDNGVHRQIISFGGRFNAKLTEIDAESRRILIVEVGQKVRRYLADNMTREKIRDHTGTLRRSVLKADVKATAISPQGLVGREKGETEGFRFTIELAELMRPERLNDPARSTRYYGPIVFQGRPGILPKAMRGKGGGIPFLRFEACNDHGGNHWITARSVRSARPRDILRLDEDQKTELALLSMQALAGALEKAGYDTHEFTPSQRS